MNLESSRNANLILLVIVVLAFALRLMTAILLPTIHHPDEVFQYLEQGHRLAFGYGVVPWEYREGLRLWLIPGVLAGLMRLTVWVTGDTTTYLFVIAATLSALSTTIVVTSWLWARQLAGLTGSVITAVIMATWFELVYFGSKPLTECLAATTLFVGAYWLCGAEQSVRSVLLGGAMLGLTFVLRLHLAPAIALVGLLGLARTTKKLTWLQAAGAAGLVVVAAGFLDWATWGRPFHSFWTNVQVNVVDDRASRYGIASWYWYIKEYVFLWSGFVVPLIILVLTGARRALVVLVVPIVIVASHTFISHKELRFIFPAIPFLLLAAGVGTANLLAAVRTKCPSWQGRWLLLATIGSWVATSAVLGVGDRYRSNFNRGAASLTAFSELGDRPGLCGIGFIGIQWYETAGYTYLHKPVPLYPIRSPELLAAMGNAFNAIVAPRDFMVQDTSFSSQGCYSDAICVFRREGGCSGDFEDRTINEVLKRIGA